MLKNFAALFFIAILTFVSGCSLIADPLEDPADRVVSLTTGALERDTVSSLYGRVFAEAKMPTNRYATDQAWVRADRPASVEKVAMKVRSEIRSVFSDPSTFTGRNDVLQRQALATCAVAANAVPAEADWSHERALWRSAVKLGSDEPSGYEWRDLRDACDARIVGHLDRGGAVVVPSRDGTI